MVDSEVIIKSALSMSRHVHGSESTCRTRNVGVAAASIVYVIHTLRVDRGHRVVRTLLAKIESPEFFDFGWFFERNESSTVIVNISVSARSITSIELSSCVSHMCFRQNTATYICHFELRLNKIYF